MAIRDLLGRLAGLLRRRRDPLHGAIVPSVRRRYFAGIRRARLAELDAAAHRGSMHRVPGRRVRPERAVGAVGR
jgi:hypothetical protein